MSIVRSLCKKHTDLTDGEIKRIEHVAELLQMLANVASADVLVDCLTSNGDLIVVAEAKPSYIASSYKTSAVGLFAQKENEPAVVRTFRLGVASRQIKAVTRESVQVVQSVEPIRYGRRVIGVLIVEKRVDEQRHVNEHLQFSQQSYKRIANALTHMIDESNWLAECIDDALLMVDQNGIVAFRNSLAKKLYARLGVRDEILGVPHDAIRLTDYRPGEEEDYSVVEAKIGNRYLSIKYVWLGTRGMAYAAVIKDITDRKAQEKELILKSVAIKEMHHRIKNNLQTIASLLRLQVRRTKSEETSRVLGESMNRILSIAATHELLARSGIDNIKIGGVILNIKNNTVRYFARPNFDIDVQLEGDDFEVESDLATTIALVINELLQNSLEYAFMDRNKGNVRIVIRKGEPYSRIKVIDDGVGFDINHAEKSSLGLSIVKSLVQDKLRGEMNIQSDKDGTIAVFTFMNNLMTCSDAM